MKSAVASVATLCVCVALGCASETFEDFGNVPYGVSDGVAGAASAGSSGSSSSFGGSSAGVAGAASGLVGSAGSSGSVSAGSGGNGGNGGNGGSGGSGGSGGITAGSGGSGGAAVPTDGPGLYGFYCAACHGEQGRGSMLAPDIMHPMRDYSKWVVRNGRAQTTFPKPMEKWTPDKLSDAQLTLIFDYLDTPPQATTGAALFLDYCANCHGANGKGGPTTHDITTEVGEVLMQVRQGAHPGEYEMRKEFMPLFPTSRISDAELILIRDYVESL